MLLLSLFIGLGLGLGLALADGPAAVGPRLPQVEQSVAAAYPADLLEQGLDGDLLLEVDVDADGRVLGAAVVQASDPRFAQPALDALLAFRFTPALDSEGNPSGARIQYRYRFKAEAAPPLAIEGTLQDLAGELPLPGLRVVASDDQDRVVFATTDDEGRFRIAGLAPGPWVVRAGGEGGWQVASADVSVSEGTVQQLTLSLEPATARRADRTDLTIEVVGEAPTDEVTERVLGADEIEFLPGTSGDVVRAVQNLPGVARPPLNVGQLIIRGTPPEDSAYGLDGARIPLVFHFAGLTTVLSTESIEEVAYLPGSYGVRYGRALGGFVDLRTEVPLPEEGRSVASIDLYQTQLFTEQRLGSRTAVSLSGRRSYVDALLTPILSSGDLTVRAPRYYDAQARITHQTARGDMLDALYLMSDDSFAFLGKDSDGNDVTFAGFGDSFHKLRLRWLRDLGGGWSNELVALAGPEKRAFQFVRDSDAYEKRLTLNLREELRRELGEDRHLGGRLGLDLLTGREAYLYDVAFYPTVEEGAAWYVAPAPYAELSARLGGLTLTPGLRADARLYPKVTLFSVDPRLGLRWALGTSTTLKAGSGLYSQQPGWREVNPDADGNPDLGAERALQNSVGVEHQLGPDLRLEVAGFYNALFDLVVGREDRFYFFSGPPPQGPFDTGPYGNDGTGRVYGVEGLLRYSGEKTTALVAATVSRSERTGRDGVTRLFEYDQPVVVNALASRQLPRNWRLGARFRFGSGNPYTPVENRWYSLEERQWVPVYGDSGSERLRAFYSLDLRVDRVYEFRRWTLTTYLDIENATYARNVEVMAYSEDYSEEEPIEGLPPLPTFGFKGEW